MNTADWLVMWFLLLIILTVILEPGNMVLTMFYGGAALFFVGISFLVRAIEGTKVNRRK